MTRQEWIDQYVAAMIAGGSELPEVSLRARAEEDSDSTEELGCTNPDDWEAPSVVAKENLQAEAHGY